MAIKNELQFLERCCVPICGIPPLLGSLMALHHCETNFEAFDLGFL